jgi:hypothetical protein
MMSTGPSPIGLIGDVDFSAEGILRDGQFQITHRSHLMLVACSAAKHLRLASTGFIEISPWGL